MRRCDYIITGFALALWVTVFGSALAEWSAVGGGISGYNVHALAVNGSDVYAGGRFTKAGNINASHIAKWNGCKWSSLGGGVKARISTLAINGSDVYAAGHKLLAVTGSHVAKWDGREWSAVGSVNDHVSTLAVSGSYLYAGGWFTSPVFRFAKWDGSAWSAVGGGVSGFVYALAVSGSDVYVGGNFHKVGSVSAKHIAKWNGNTWSALGDGMDIPRVSVLAVNGSDVYAGGDFINAGDVRVNRIAKWNGTGWSAMGNGMNGRVTALAVSGSDLYAGGNFTVAGDEYVKYVAKWNGITWSALEGGMDNRLVTLAVSGSDLFAGGVFTKADNVDVYRIAKWNFASPNNDSLKICPSAKASLSPSATASPESSPLASPTPSISATARVPDTNITSTIVHHMDTLRFTASSRQGWAGISQLALISGFTFKDHFHVESTVVKSHGNKGACVAGSGFVDGSTQFMSAATPATLQRVSKKVLPILLARSFKGLAQTVSNLAPRCLQVSPAGNLPGASTMIHVSATNSTVQPESRMIRPGETGVFTVVATSSLLKHQSITSTVSQYPPGVSIALAVEQFELIQVPVALPVLEGIATFDAPVSLPFSAANWSLLYSMLQGVKTASTLSRLSTRPYEMRVSGGDVLVLHAAQPASFMPGMQAWVGAVSARVNAVSTDGALAVLQLPSFGVLCGENEACQQPGATPYRPLWLLNPVVSPAGWLSSVRQALAHAAKHQPVNTTDVHQTYDVPPAWYVANTTAWAAATKLVAPDLHTVIASSSQSFGGGSVCPHSCPGNSLPDGTNLVDATAAGYGLTVSAACSGFEEPGPQCLQPGAHCAFGAGDYCKPCPDGAVCPGGFRQWALPGYWLPHEAATIDPRPCRRPASRCLGHSVDLRGSKCAPGYSEHSVACSGCAAGHYMSLASTCVKCPPGSDAGAFAGFGRLVLYAAGLCGALVFLALTIHVVKRKKEKLVVSLRSAGTWLFWVITTLQLVGQVSSKLESTLPELLKQYLSYTSVTLANTDVLVHPSCSSAPPLLWPTVRLGCLFALGIIWTALLVPTSTACRNAQGQLRCTAVWHRMQRALILALTMLHPLAIVQSTDMLACTSTPAPTIITTSDGAVHVKTVPRLMLQGYAGITCFADDHALAGGFAILVLLVIGLSFPMITYWQTSRWLQAAPVEMPIADAVSKSHISATVRAFSRGRILMLLWACH